MRADADARADCKPRYQPLADQLDALHAAEANGKPWTRMAEINVLVMQ